MLKCSATFPNYFEHTLIQSVYFFCRPIAKRAKVLKEAGKLASTGNNPQSISIRKSNKTFTQQ